MSRINEKIGAWLLEGENTRTELACALGVTTQTLRNKLNGETDWTWPQAIRIAELTGTSLDELAGVSDGSPD